MSKEKRDGASEASIYDGNMAGGNDPTPEQLRAMGAVELPQGREAIKQEVARLTQDFKQVFYWTPKPQSWLEKHFGGGEPPFGIHPKTREIMQCRPYDEVALVIHDPVLWQQAMVKLRYEDKVEIILEVDNLHYGLKMTGSQVRRKFVPCRKGERDVTGYLHKGG